MIQLFQNQIKAFNSLISRLCLPNPKYTPDKLESEIAHSRNKILFNLSLIFIVVFLIDATVLRPSATTGIAICLLHLTTMVVLVLSCRYHPIIYQCYHILVSVTYGPNVAKTGEEGIYRAWFSAITLPLLTYLFTGSLNCLIIQAVFQFIYLNNFYEPIMEKTMIYNTAESSHKALTQSTNISIIYIVIVTILIHWFMQKAYRKVVIIEQKKNEIENQKVFLMGFSHELRNLINSLTGNVKLASFENLPERAKALLLNAEVCGELLLHLVNNILDTGKVEIGELEVNPVPTRIYDTLARLWGVCSELIKKKNLRGQMMISKELPKNIVIDHYRLTQILLNLVGNAMKFTETGSIDIRVDWITRSDKVEEKCFQPYPFNYIDEYDEGLFQKQRVFGSLDNSIMTLNLSTNKLELHENIPSHPNNKTKGVFKISVTDTGCGIAREETEKLFNKFTQVTSDPSKKKLGTGLGLFITKQLCQKMNGEVRVYSQKDVGSSFVFCIPSDVVLQREECNHFSTESLKRLISRQNLKTMIVDDLLFNCNILKSFFEKLEIKVIGTAMNGLDAYQKYLQHIDKGECPQIVTMDLDMPLMDGKEAARKIRKLERERGIQPCFMIIISGNCTDSEISECLNREGSIKADEFIKKPATIDELLRVIGNHFSKLDGKKNSL